MPQVSLVAVRPVESHVYSFKHFLYQTFVFPNIRTDWWLWSCALHDFTSRWSSLKVGLQQSSWKVSQKLMKRVKHVVALRASLAMWENSELARLNHSVRSVASGPSKLHTTMFPQHALRMTSCHAGSLQCWFETQLWEPDYSVVALRNGAQTSLQNLMIAPKRGRSDPAQQASKCMHVNKSWKNSCQRWPQTNKCTCSSIIENKSADNTRCRKHVIDNASDRCALTPAHRSCNANHPQIVSLHTGNV